VLYRVQQVLDYMVSSILFCFALQNVMHSYGSYAETYSDSLLYSCWIKCAAYNSTDAWYRQWT